VSDKIITLAAVPQYFYCPGCAGECIKPMRDFQDNIRCPMHLGAGPLKEYAHPDQMPVPFDVREAYAERIVEGLDLGDLIIMCQDLLMNQFAEMNPENLRGEIRDVYPDLLDG
jgi:hypothetical protein